MGICDMKGVFTLTHAHLPSLKLQPQSHPDDHEDPQLKTCAAQNKMTTCSCVELAAESEW